MAQRGKMLRDLANKKKSGSSESLDSSKKDFKTNPGSKKDECQQDVLQSPEGRFQIYCSSSKEETVWNRQ